ncbi:hypothetical protein [Cellulosilyticum sp. WCF-2]|uniref:hypothetical protein n=1 Tax=Cellulosilyticum sp. WCF-2 TaxID=2497860 RepID=UPI000F8DCEC6|nr:hypothetical protein [Cellulosilyticum sp. WCF-2]QEH68228.1 hypothetical protein EKH84_07425 [Cellulosilyticum sp. WCF-2]
MNALTRFEPSTPVRYDVMNAMCTEVEARDTDLQEQINVLKSKTQIPLPYNSGFVDYATGALESYVVKNGLNECKLVINAKPSTGQFSAGQTAIATLPSGYIPSKGYSVGARNSAMTGCSVEILPNGTINVYTASASDYVFAVIPYDLEV